MHLATNHWGLFTSRSLFILLAAVLGLALAIGASPAAAQVPEPARSIDAAFADVSRRFGTTITRANIPGRWNWDYINVSGPNLGCPAVLDQNIAPQSAAYVIYITIRRVGTFEYRASRDENVFLACQIPTIPPTATPTVPPTPRILPTATPLPGVSVPNAVAFIGRDGNVYITSGGGDSGPNFAGGSALTLDAGREAIGTAPFFRAARTYGQLRWSPTGAALLFTEQTMQAVWVARSGEPPALVVSGAVAGIPGAWSPDGDEIAYVVDTGVSAQDNSEQDGAAFIYQIQAVPIAAPGRGTASARVASSITYRVGCGGMNADPADALYNRETTSFGGDFQVLFWTALGFVHSTNCSGVGLALTDFNGMKRWELPDVSRAALSPDGQRIAAVTRQAGDPASGSIVLIDAASGDLQPFASQPGVDQVVWTADGRALVYSTEQPDVAATVQGRINASSGPVIMSFWPIDGLSFKLGLWGARIEGGESILLFEGEGRALVNLTPLVEQNRVLGTVISSAADLIRSINANESRDVILSKVPTTASLLVGLQFERVLDPSLPAGGGSGGGLFGIGQIAVSGQPFTVVRPR